MPEKWGSNMPTLIRLPCVMDRLGLRRTSVYERIASGHFTPPVKLGRASVWPEDEVSTIISASISGQSPDDIKALVANLVQARKQI